MSTKLYDGEITLLADTTLKFIARAPGFVDSPIGSATYTLAAATPVASPAPGSFGSAQSVTLSCATAGAAIHYTIDGSTPTSGSTLYTGVISVPASETIKAIAIVSGIANSAVFSGHYTIAGGPAALVAHLIYSPHIGGSNTTTGIDTTGATLVVVMAGSFNGWKATSVTDSNGNTYIPLTDHDDGSESIRFYYCLSPIVGPGHTFTPNFGNTLDTVVGVLAFSGVSTFHTENGGSANNTAPPMKPGAVVPAVDGSVIVAGISNYNASGSTPTIDSGFTAFAYNGDGSSNAMGSIAYLIQTTHASINPTWAYSGGSFYALAIADFAP